MANVDQFSEFAAMLIKGNSHIAPHNRLPLTANDSTLPFALSDKAAISLLPTGIYVVEGINEPPSHIAIDESLDEEDQHLLEALFKAILAKKIDSEGRELYLLKVQGLIK